MIKTLSLARFEAASLIKIYLKEYCTRFSFACTAEGKLETEICVLPKIKETGLILAPFLPVIYKCRATSKMRDKSYITEFSCFYDKQQPAV